VNDAADVGPNLEPELKRNAEPNVAASAENDAELVARARSGERQAFATLLTRHLPMARRVCRRITGSETGLEDVIQETALQALLCLDRLRDPGQFGAWLTGIALNAARQALRGRGREALSWEALWGGRLVTEPLDDGQSPAELAEAREFASAVRVAVADLPAGQRQAVLLVYLSGLSYRETAAVLGIPVGAVKTRLHKGRVTLQRRLWDLWKENVMATDVEQQMVQMRVADVRRRKTGEDERDRSVVVLEEVGGTRQLPIVVGRWESGSIALLLEKVSVPRPLTHAFTANLLRASGVRVEQVRIHRLLDETFYADVQLEGAAGRASVDARPSDCMALALELGAPIYVATDVLTAVEQARRDRAEPEQPVEVMNASAIVAQMIEQWPVGPKPVRKVDAPGA